MDIPLILSKIFSYLSLNQVLQLRLVCKEWRNFVNHFEQREELCLYQQKVPHKFKWHSDGALVRDAIKVIKGNKLDFKDPFLKNLKRLFIYRTRRNHRIDYEIGSPFSFDYEAIITSSDFFTSLNSLTSLQELRFKFENRLFNKAVELNLPNLKTLVFGWIDRGLILRLNTPNLEMLITKQITEQLHIVHPESIQILICSVMSQGANFRFPNLRRLVIRRFEYEQTFESVRLNIEDFPKLKVVELYTGNKSHISLVKEFAKSLKKQKSTVGRSDLVVLINGFKDVEIIFNMIGFCDRIAEIDLDAIWNNFDKMVGNFEYPVSLRFEDYQQLQIRCTSNEERSKFMAMMTKFKKIKSIKANEIIDPAEFLEFLADWCDRVAILELKNSASVFNDKQLIPFQSIKELHASEFRVKANYQFLLDLKNLKVFKLDTFPHYLSIEILHLAYELFKRNPNFSLFELIRYRIRRQSEDDGIKINPEARTPGGLKYNGVYHTGKTREEIFRILMKRLLE